MVSHGVDTVTQEERDQMMSFLEETNEPVTVTEVEQNPTCKFEDKQKIVSVLHSLMQENLVTHNIKREYYISA